MNILYTAEATAWGGREGRVVSSDKVLDLELAIPTEMGGPGGPKSNPEELFAAGYAACFESALRLVARMQKKAVPAETSITAKVTIGQDGAAFRLAVELHGHLPGLPQEEAATLVATAHQVCPYSAATRGNVEVKLFANDEPLPQ